MLKVMSYMEKYLPVVLMVIQLVENLLGSGKGKEKKEAAIDVASALLAEAGHPITIDTEENLSKVIDSSVSVLNKTVWKKEKKEVEKTEKKSRNR